ncbi:EpsG family protein [Devosia aurantiaca]|uniref:EpsG family protein n=1 Tax=Devosia aurantiaca TaxID=2714858 RepID=A0A6M1SPF2_9HYPH|nr:EpsG family protein [Devosia aurantiaca]NGP18554.1 EpsG family protein [Devosia aurantiaca]
MSAWIYWVPFVAFAALSFAPQRFHRAWFSAAAIVLIVYVGLRHEVGADWGAYIAMIERAGTNGLTYSLRDTDPGYAMLNWLGANGLGGIYFVNLVCATLSVIPLVIFCATRKNPALALLVAVPYLITVVYMGYTRQGVAVGFGMLAILAVERQRIVWFLCAVTVAALFHKAAVCLFVFSPALFAGRLDRPYLARAMGIALYALVLTMVLLGYEAAFLSQEYILATGDAPGPGVAEAGLRSEGAIVRLAQAVVAVAAFILIAWRTRLKPAELWLWSIVSFAILALFVLAFYRSTLADRTALFFLPLQLYAFATLPSLFRRPLALFAQIAIISCFAASYWVWLTYGSDADKWIPYNSAMGQPVLVARESSQ